jgi:hypothetical protein
MTTQSINELDGRKTRSIAILRRKGRDSARETSLKY